MKQSDDYKFYPCKNCGSLNTKRIMKIKEESSKMIICEGRKLIPEAKKVIKVFYCSSCGTTFTKKKIKDSYCFQCVDRRCEKK